GPGSGIFSSPTCSTSRAGPLRVYQAARINRAPVFCITDITCSSPRTIPLTMHQRIQRLAGLRHLGARLACRLVWVTEGDRRAHETFARNAEDSLRVRRTASN